ncbi:MAG: hypothetical protein ACK5KN_04265 [Dysgonomonas sp.]|uniref:hypothetical protein n=1 Tax=Dysgonomonas sp. TaxID=1891233 RepID=UPI003A8540A3
MEQIEKLKSMVKKAFLYNNQEVVIIGFADCVGEYGDDCEIYLNTGRTIEWKMSDLITNLNRFRPVTNTVVVLANERLNQVSSVNHTVIQNMRDVILETITKVKESPTPEVISQAKQVFQGVNTLTNLAKTELEYRKYMDIRDNQK